MTINEKLDFLTLENKLLWEILTYYKKLIAESDNSSESGFDFDYSKEALFNDRLKEVKTRFFVRTSDLWVKKIDWDTIWKNIEVDIRERFYEGWKK
jgi:hypothetical protein